MKKVNSLNVMATSTCQVSSKEEEMDVEERDSYEEEQEREFRCIKQQ